MRKPLVSVIVATRNGEKFLRPALESLFAQDYSPIEAILVDDGSDDGTPEIASSFQSSDSWLSVHDIRMVGV